MSDFSILDFFVISSIDFINKFVVPFSDKTELVEINLSS